MEPITPLTLLIYVPALLAMLALYGNPLRVFFERWFNKKNITLDTVERAILTLALGASAIPLIVMVLSWLGNLLDVFTVRVLMIPFAVANLYLYREHLKPFRPKLVMPDARATIVLLVFLMVFVFHLYPSLGLFVHPGDDPKLYSVITLRIVENNGYTTSWGSFAPPTWYEEKTHLTIAGFAGTCAFFHLLTGLSIEKTVLLLTLMYTSLISLGVYFLAKRLFKSAGIALCSAFVFGMLIREPSIGWFAWGGHAELSSLFVLPIVIGLFWEIFRNDYIGFKYLLYLAFLMSGMFMLHPFSAFYLAFCLIPYFLIFIFKKRRLAPVLKSLAVFPTSIMLILPVFITAIGPEMAISQQYASRFSPVWSSFISWNQSPDQILYSILLRLLAVYGIGTFFMLIACIDVLRSHKIDREPLILLVAWAFTVFLVQENHPTGLYVIPFPLWYRINPNRVFTLTSFTVSVIMGIAIFKASEYIIKESSFRKGKFVQTLKFIYKKTFSRKALWIILLLCLLEISFNVVQNSVSLESVPVTEADISAFNWIRYNTPSDATFFVSIADAGQWIPVYTHRRVLIPFGVVTNYTLYDQYYDIYPAFCDDPHSLKGLQFLNYHNVSYVYVGSRTIRNRKKFNTSLLTNSLVFNEVYNKSNVHIFRYLGATTITIFTDDDFLSGWNTGAGYGGTVDASTDGDIYKLGTTSGSYVYSTHDLSLNNTQSILYLIVKWRTSGTATYKIQLDIDGNSYVLIDRQTSSMWTTSIINLNNYIMGQITSVSIFVEGDGYGYTDFITFNQLVPLRDGINGKNNA